MKIEVRPSFPVKEGEQDFAQSCESARMAIC